MQFGFSVILLVFRRYDCPAFPRVAYLPDNSKGQKVLRLLRKAFNQRLIFTIGRSVTSGKFAANCELTERFSCKVRCCISTKGRDNVVTWNDIHHKTDLLAGGEHSYPDPNYLDDVIDDLAQHGVVEK